MNQNPKLFIFETGVGDVGVVEYTPTAIFALISNIIKPNKSITFRLKAVEDIIEDDTNV